MLGKKEHTAVTETGFNGAPVEDFVNFGLLFCESGGNSIGGAVSFIAKFLITVCADAL